MFASYLDKSPQFKITEPVTSFSDVATTKPVTKSIAFHQHGNELAITLEGDNLWFVNSIQVGTLNKLSVSAMATNQKSIQFNLQYKPNPELSITADAEVKVIVDSQFCKPIKSSLKVTKKVRTTYVHRYINVQVRICVCTYLTYLLIDNYQLPF